MKPSGILKFVNECHSTEGKILGEDRPVPFFIENKYGPNNKLTHQHDTEFNLGNKIVKSFGLKTTLILTKIVANVVTLLINCINTFL